MQEITVACATKALASGSIALSTDGLQVKDDDKAQAESEFPRGNRYIFSFSLASERFREVESIVDSGDSGQETQILGSSGESCRRAWAVRRHAIPTCLLPHGVIGSLSLLPYPTP